MYMHMSFCACILEGRDIIQFSIKFQRKNIWVKITNQSRGKLNQGRLINPAGKIKLSCQKTNLQQ